MIWLFTILAVLVLGAVVVVAAGRGGELAETFDDRPDVRVRADGPLSAADLRQVRFTTAFRGYRMSEVDSLLERLSVELDRDQQRSDPGEDGDPPARHRAQDSAQEPRESPEED